jgi:hypothetical protein
MDAVGAGCSEIRSAARTAYIKFHDVRASERASASASLLYDDTTADRQASLACRCGTSRKRLCSRGVMSWPISLVRCALPPPQPHSLSLSLSLSLWAVECRDLRRMQSWHSLAPQRVRNPQHTRSHAEEWVEQIRQWSWPVGGEGCVSLYIDLTTCVWGLGVRRRSTRSTRQIVSRPWLGSTGWSTSLAEETTYRRGCRGLARVVLYLKSALIDSRESQGGREERESIGLKCR